MHSNAPKTQLNIDTGGDDDGEKRDESGGKAPAAAADVSPHGNEIQFMAPYSSQPPKGPMSHPLFSAVSAIENNGGVVTQAGLGKGGLVPTGPEAPR